MRLELSHAFFQRFLILGDLLDQLQLLRQFQPLQRGVLQIRIIDFDAGLARLLENARDPGVRVLYIKNWIFARLLFGQLQIEIEMGVGSAHEKEEARGIPADLFQDLPQRDEFSEPFAHSDRLASAGELDHLNQHDPEEIGVKSKRLDGRLQPLDVPVMVRSPNIDQFLEAPLQLIPMISDIAREVSQIAVAF